MKHILVVDDDERLRDLLKRYLVRRDYQVTTCADAASADHLMKSIDFDLVVLDVMMPGEDGISFVRRLRPGNVAPVLLLTAKSDIESRLDGFEAGIDDFLSKPFEPRELVWRIEAILRRAGSTALRSGLAVFGDYHFDIEAQRLARGEEKIELTRNERDVLAHFLQYAGETISREDLLGVLGEGSGLRNVDVTITRLRKKIEPDPKNPQYIHTVRGMGYKLMHR